jgi:hypothetical protein
VGISIAFLRGPAVKQKLVISITSPDSTLVFKLFGGSSSMGAQRKGFKFSYVVLCFVALAVSIFVLGGILFWTLEHTDIVAFVTILLAVTILEAILIFSLFKGTSIPKNNVGDERGGRGMSLRLIFTKMTMPPKLVQKS